MKNLIHTCKANSVTELNVYLKKVGLCTLKKAYFIKHISKIIITHPQLCWSNENS